MNMECDTVDISSIKIQSIVGIAFLANKICSGNVEALLFKNTTTILCHNLN